MTEIFQPTFLRLWSDNRKSKIQKRPRGLKWAVFLALLVEWLGVAHPQQLAKGSRIGFLFVSIKDQPHIEEFRQRLHDLGYVEGKNITIEYR